MTESERAKPSRHQYSGGENLEVMQQAKKYNHFLRQLVRKFAGDPATVLDFGAGIGTFSDSLDIPPRQVHCVEPDSAARASLTEKGFQVHAGLSDLGSASISYVFTLNVLEHIEDDVAILQELYRVLEPGGRMLVYVPAFTVLYSSMDRYVGHFRRYHMAGLVDIVERAGFEVDEKAYTDALGFFVTLAYRLADNHEPAPLNFRMVRIYDRYLFPLSRALSVPLARVLGKNLYLVATKPAA